MKTILTLLVGFVLSSSLRAGVLPNNAVVDGRTISEWTAQWWNWIYGQSTNQSSMLDGDGSRAGNGQPGGSVFFVANLARPGTVARTFAVPEGSYLLFSARYVTLDNVDFPVALSEAELRDAAAGVVDLMTNVHASIDGAPIDVLAHRVLSPVFSFDFQTADNLNSYTSGHPVTGLVDPIVSDGYWIMLEPLPVGNHVLSFGGEIAPPFNSSKQITDNITVIGANHPPVADASATPARVISPNNHNATVVLNGLRSSDPDNDPLTFAWLEGGSLIGAGVLSTNLLATGTHEISLIVSDGQLAATNTITVDVITPCQAIGDLISRVESAHLARHKVRALVEELREACAALEQGARGGEWHRRAQIHRAIHELREFQHDVREELARRNPDLSALLIEAAQEIIEAINPAPRPRERD